jgi:hypothetical protein
MANMDQDDDLLGNSSFNQRELGGTDDELWIDETELSSGEALQDTSPNKFGGWDRSDIADFDDLATSEGVMGEVQAILNKRERTNGVQYLTVWQDQTADEARWVPLDTLKDIGALTYVERFEAEESLIAMFRDQDDEDSLDSDDIMDVDDDNDYGDDEEDLIKRKIDRMTDESIARLLEKQEELGMGSNELLLFDDTADADAEDALPVPIPAWNLVKKKSPRNTRSNRPTNAFPPASTLVDAYDGFDIMDFDRPSLKKKSKGRKGKLEFNISDSELEAAMQDAWKNDRVKKKERKERREELRAAGLLGSKNGKPDLKQKYKEGMGFHDVKDEIKTFLIRNDTT